MLLHTQITPNLLQCGSHACHWESVLAWIFGKAGVVMVLLVKELLSLATPTNNVSYSWPYSSGIDSLQQCEVPGQLQPQGHCVQSKLSCFTVVMW
jgi:hypothetical protein